MRSERDHRAASQLPVDALVRKATSKSTLAICAQSLPEQIEEAESHGLGTNTITFC